MLRIVTVLLLLMLFLSFRKHGCLVAGTKMTDIACNELDCNPDDVCACKGSDITIPWHIPYTDEIFTADWSKEDASGSLTTIFSQDTSGTITDYTGSKSVHNGNGSITLTPVDASDTGIYRCAVAYNLNTHSSVTGTVTVSVYDAPAGLSYSQMTLGSATTYKCTATYNGNPAALLNVKV
ncbi:uncharacterized protein LOC123560189 isoform X2 [Mercenaria mercenaria]|uniref:uncharacterized protein LOC123560189 isoform X2 n=1 Tax=Mercenaria mercenaria TaxID=6596 RepID=UPI00234F5100|nr:uncharacterized protein LOC123560189 isoform X2 [Mercenaria mercenaria]